MLSTERASADDGRDSPRHGCWSSVLASSCCALRARGGARRAAGDRRRRRRRRAAARSATSISPSTSPTAPGEPTQAALRRRAGAGRSRCSRDGKASRSPSSTSPTWSARAARTACSRSPSTPTTRRTGRFYVYYTDNDGRHPRRRVQARRRQRRSPSPGSRRKVLEVPHPARQPQRRPAPVRPRRAALHRHRRRRLRRRSRRTTPRTSNSLLGKILRIDPRAARARYARPARQPVRRRAGARRDLRLRPAQPVPLLLRLATRRRSRSPTSARAPVEEIDYETSASAAARTSAGTRSRASAPFDCGARPAPTRRPSRSHAYEHAGSGSCTVTGGYVVHDPALPTLRGRYVFTDLCEGDSCAASSPRRRRGRRRAARRPSVGLARARFGEDRRGQHLRRLARRRRLPARPVSAPRAPRRAGAGCRARAVARRRVAGAARAGAGRRRRGLAQIGSFNQPVYVDRAAGAPRLLFVVEQAGPVTRSLRRRRAASRPFLDISEQGRGRRRARACSRSPSPPTTETRPLLRLLHATTAATSWSTSSSRSRDGSGRADASSAPRACSTIPHPRVREPQRRPARSSAPTAASTSATGDGGSGGDPDENAQNRDSLLGKILRIDPHARRRPALLRAPRQPVRRRAGPRRDLRARPAQSVPLLVRPRDAATIVIGDVGQDALRGDRLRVAAGRPRRELRLGRLRGRPAASTRSRREPDPGRPTSRRSTTTRTAAATASITGGLRGPRPGAAGAVRPLRLRRLLQGRAPQPDPAASSGAQDEAPTRPRQEPSASSSFGE